MSAKPREQRLETDKPNGPRIADILHKKRADYTEDDIAQMRRLIGYV